jgi:hypothetical protein
LCIIIGQQLLEIRAYGWRDEMRRKKDLDFKTLAYISDHPGAERSEIAKHLGYPEQKAHAAVDARLRRLIADGRLQEGLSVTDAWKGELIKSYVFIDTVFQDDGDTARDEEANYQQDLVDNIKRKLGTDRYRGAIFLDSVEIVMGADFDIVLILRANDVSPIGSFVTGFLRSHRYVHKTRTIMAWPWQSSSTNPSQDGGDSAVEAAKGRAKG